METLPQISLFKTLWTLLFNVKGRAEFLARQAVGRGPFIRVPFPGRPIILVNSPTAIEEILLKKAAVFQKSFDYRVMARLLGKGILTSEGTEWKADRGEIQSHFKPSFIAKHEPMIQAEVDRSLETLADGQTLDVLGWSSRMTGRIITIKLFGRSFSDAEIDRIVDLFETAQKQITLGIVVPERVQSLARRFGIGGIFHRRLGIVRQKLTALIVRELANTGNAEHSILNVLNEVASARALTPAARLDWIVDQVLTFFIAGYETTAVSITWCLHLLSLHPESQDRLRADGEYLGAVMHESMRLFPPIAMMGRENTERVEIEGRYFPAGSTFLISPYLIHHSPEFWENPEGFRPDRFTSTEGRASLRLKFIPFGLGPRSCIGQSFAVLELEVALTSFLRRYRIQPTDRNRALKTKGIPLLSFRPSRPVNLRLAALSGSPSNP